MIRRRWFARSLYKAERCGVSGLERERRRPFSSFTIFPGFHHPFSPSLLRLAWRANVDTYAHTHTHQCWPTDEWEGPARSEGRRGRGSFHHILYLCVGSVFYNCYDNVCNDGAFEERERARARTHTLVLRRPPRGKEDESVTRDLVRVKLGVCHKEKRRGGENLLRYYCYYYYSCYYYEWS